MERDPLLESLGGAEALLQLAPGIDLRRLEIGLMEGFILSRIGSGVRVREICQISGLGEEQTLKILVKLRKSGIIVGSRAAPAAPPRPARTGGGDEPRRTRSGHPVREPLWKAKEQGKDPRLLGSKAPPPPPRDLGRLDTRPLEHTGVYRVVQAVRAATDHAAPRPTATSSGAGQVRVPTEAAATHKPGPAGSGVDARNAVRAPTESAAAKSSAASGSADTRRPSLRSLIDASAPPSNGGGSTGAESQQASPREPSRTATSAVGVARTSLNNSPAKTFNGPTRSVLDAASGSPGKAERPIAEAPELPYYNTPPTPEALEKLAARSVQLSEEEQAEQVDLDDEQKRLIVYLHRRRAQLDYYQILAVAPEVEQQALRKAFLRRTQLFHPDRYYSKTLGSYGAKIHELYKAICVAYDTLSDSRSRVLYDQTLQRSRQFADVPGGVNISVQAANLFDEGRRLADAGDLPAAEAALIQACDMDPRSERYRAQLHRVQEQIREKRASEARRKALDEIQHGRFAQAVDPLRESSQIRQSAEDLTLLANCLLEAGLDVREAARLARRALELKPELTDAALIASLAEERQGNLAAAHQVLEPFKDQARTNRRLAERLAQLSGKA